MATKDFDLDGKLCPFIIMRVLREVGRLAPGDCARFLVDDPLAIKSVPEELGETRDIVVGIEKRRGGWLIEIQRHAAPR